MKTGLNNNSNKAVCTPIFKASELSKLKIKIQNNTQLIVSKDQQIQQLKAQIRKGSPVKSPEQSRLQIGGSNSPSFGLSNKINDIQIRLSSLVQNQTKLGQKIHEIGTKVQYVQRGLLSILACKMTNIQAKISQYADKSTIRLNNIQINLANKLKKDINIVNHKQVKSVVPIQVHQNIQSLAHWIEGLRQEVLTFKQKQFRYENSNVINLRKDINLLKNTVGDLQKKFASAHNRLKTSKCSSRKNFDSNKKNASFHSNFFDDYQQVYDQLDSINQDQFFHPLEESAKRFHQHKDMGRPTHHHSHAKPTAHNQSFENFTSDQEQEDSPNVKRLIKALRQGAYKLPVPIEVDLTGYIRKKIDQKYLIDTDKKGFVLTTVELNQCKEKGLLIW